jgi:Na+/melibiose symporter-like transporter
MTGDVNERAKLNSFRFISVNAAQFIVGGFTLPLVAKFAVGHDKQHGWSMVMALWAVVCLVLFLTTFFTTKERIQPINKEKTSPGRDFADLAHNHPWMIMFCLTFVHFTILALRGGALYNYYHNYADKAALYDWLHGLGLTAAAGSPSSGGILEWVGYIVHGDKSNLADSNVADVGNSIINMIGTGVTIIVILLSPSLAKKFGKKAVTVAGFGLACLSSLAFYLLSPTNVAGMVALTILTAIFYAPTIALVWAIYADVADYSEWKTGRRATGIIFATIGFGLKLGLSLGASAGLWIMAGFYHYDPKAALTPENLQGMRMLSSVYVGILFGVCTLFLIANPLNKRLTIQIADELAARRAKVAGQNA